MCGIAGYIQLNGSNVDREKIERMVAALKHRGPDAQTVHLDGPVGLGHARLSIIDLEGGHQPLFNEDRSVAVICNGEIYNYRELRTELLCRGHQFRTGSDCEVIAHLWEEHGPQLVDRLRGMFAFVLYDNQQGIVFGARDHFGQKPLFYAQSPTRFAFASEVKGLLALDDVSRELDPQGLDQFLFYQFVPQPRTLFTQIKKLPAASHFELRIPVVSPSRSLSPDTSRTNVAGKSQRSVGTSALTIQSYWQPTFAPDTSKTTNHLEVVEAGLIDAVQSHLVADVPVGVFLSGGIDSSLITAIAAKLSAGPLQTFSISFPGSEHDEAIFARTVATALHTKHREFPFAPSDMALALTQAAVLFDQPLADTAVLPLMALSQAASRYVKVALTGDGGDELFAGYRKYRRMTGIISRLNWATKISGALFPIHKLAACHPDSLGLRKLQSRLAMAMVPDCRSEYSRLGWEGWERFSLYKPDWAESLNCDFETINQRNSTVPIPGDSLNAALRLDQGTVLADRLLLKGDYSTMAFGLESRAPLLDHYLAGIASRLPLHFKATPSTTKVALREIARRYLPEEIITRRKKGFSMPLDRWLRHELRDWTRTCLLDESVSLSRFFRRAAIEKLLAEHDAGENHAGRIHTLLTFELWYRHYVA